MQPSTGVSSPATLAWNMESFGLPYFPQGPVIRETFPRLFTPYRFRLFTPYRAKNLRLFTPPVK